MKLLGTVLTVSALALAGCASTKPANVVPQANGVYKVTGIAATENDALQSALKTAEATCEKRNLRHVVSDQITMYKGVVSQDTNKTVNKAQELAVYAGLWIPTLSGDSDYEVALTFTCEK